jgi:4-alpha-glucanotransferase
MQLKNFGFTHKSGILLPISALPNKYGIGSFGKDAFDFVDFLHETGTKCWQVLPLNPTSYGDSPYQSPASVAGNPYFIDLDILCQKGFLSTRDLKEHCHKTDRVDYGWLFSTRYTVLRKAYDRFLRKNGIMAQEYLTFEKSNKGWLQDYALFMALKVHYDYCPWTMWKDEHKDVERARKQSKPFEKECGFWKWLQFEFFSQWQALKKYAKSKVLS